MTLKPPALISKNQQGFTLIELLVVIAIIGTLASVVLASLSDARARAQDAKRLQDMQQIRTALELFYQDYERYPDKRDGVGGNNGAAELIGVGNPIDTALEPYLSPMPRDPKHDAGFGMIPTPTGAYYYVYDPWHCNNPNPGVSCDDCGITSGSAGISSAGLPAVIAFGFNKAEALSDLQKGTYAGIDGNMCSNDYNQVLVPASDPSTI